MATRRTYSFFTKSGINRLLTSAKPPKALTTPTSSHGSSTSSSNSTAITVRGTDSTSTVVSSDPSTTGSNDLEHGQSSSAVDATAENKARTQPVATADEPSSCDKQHETHQASSSSERRSHESTNPHNLHERGPMLYPQPSKEVLSLHSFFSLHRPLLLLPEHAVQPLFNPPTGRSTIFDDLNTRQQDIGVRENNILAGEAGVNGVRGKSEPLFEVELGSGRPLPRDDGISLQGLITDEELPEADADAARLLGRSYIINNIGSFVDWQNVLKTLGDAGAQSNAEKISAAAAEVMENPEMPFGGGVAMDSVKRKRKKKMNKHIYKKRRKRERAQRRKLGK